MMAWAKIKSFTVGVLMFMAAGYFAIHGLGVGGDKGYLSLGGLDQDIELAEQKLSELRANRQWLENRVSLVTENKIDEDLLGELARTEGGLYAPDEIIIDIN